MKNAAKLILILLLVSCSEAPKIIYSYNVKKQYFNRFQFEIDKVKCEMTATDIGPIDSDAKSLDGLVCISKELYSQAFAEAKAECINNQSVVDVK